MWPFRSKSAFPELEERLERLERENRALKADMGSLWDKVLENVQRWNKRAEIVTKAREASVDTRATEEGLPGQRGNPTAIALLEKRGRHVS